MPRPPTPPASIIIISCSLNVTSRSHRLAQAAEQSLRTVAADVELVDLREWELPFCDGGESYEHPSVKPLSDRIRQADAILVASPVYNYDLNAAAKNLVEMTGSAWEEKPVGFLCSAGGRSSYMSPIGLANSLMFDFRSIVVPRFVYAVKDDFDSQGNVSDALRGRIEQLTRTTVELAQALAWVRGASAPRSDTPA